MSIAEMLGLFALALGAWFLWDSLKVREAANTAMRTACEARGMFFLNDTVALKSLWPVRNDEGHVMLRRIYDFEYSDTGHNRRKGRIALVGDTVSELDIVPAPTGE